MIWRFVAGALFSFLLGSAAHAGGMSKAEADAHCKPGALSTPETATSTWSGGLHPTASSLTPMTVEGAIHVHPFEAECIVSAYYPRVRLIAPIADEFLIPDTHRIIGGGAGGSFADDTQRMVEQRLKEITSGDRTMPLVIYCHHRSCFLSYNLALRAARAGYTNIYWFRSGLSGWRQLRKPVSKDGAGKMHYYCINPKEEAHYYSRVFSGTYWLADQYRTAFNAFTYSRYGEWGAAHSRCQSFSELGTAQKALEEAETGSARYGNKPVRTNWTP